MVWPVAWPRCTALDSVAYYSLDKLVLSPLTVSYLGCTFKLPGLKEKTLMFSRCLIVLCSVAIKMSLATLVLV